MPVPFELLSQLPIANAGGAAPPPGGGILPTLIMFAPLILLFYFLILRPQQAQEKKRRQMIEALKKNDRVLTSAGIYGTIVSIDSNEDRMVLKVADNTKMDMTRSSVIRIFENSNDKSAESR